MVVIHCFPWDKHLVKYHEVKDLGGEHGNIQVQDVWKRD